MVPVPHSATDERVLLECISGRTLIDLYFFLFLTGSSTKKNFRSDYSNVFEENPAMFLDDDFYN